MESFIRIIQLIKWPVTIIILSCIFKKPLSDLIPYIKTIKYKDFEAKFSGKLEDLKKDAKNLPCSLDVFVSDSVNVKEAITAEEILTSSGLELYTKLAKIDPRSAVIEAWRKLELSIHEKTRMLGTKRNIRTGRAIEILNKKGLIDSSEKHMIYELRKMRNEAVHALSFELTFFDAVRYADLANRLACYIQDRFKK